MQYLTDSGMALFLKLEKGKVAVRKAVPEFLAYQACRRCYKIFAPTKPAQPSSATPDDCCCVAIDRCLEVPVRLHQIYAKVETFQRLCEYNATHPFDCSKH